ncbi:MAG: TolC family protein [Flavobacteriales bacterium]|nr:TolC family protein [Flavobacteriales bacterium]MBK7942236.1 TolC family protein [Flavobacteriales bacterium]
MRIWRNIAASLVWCLCTGVFAQDTLTLDGAIQQALANEHGIRIARNEAAIADEAATAGNAGLLPRIDASGRGNYSNQDTKLDFTEGIPDVSRNGVVNTSLAGQVGLTYTLFNGMGNFAALERAELNAQLADLRTRAQVEGTLTQVIALYYAIAALDEDVAITQRILDISNDRYVRQEGKALLGGVGRLDLLNAEVDLQSDSTTFILALQRRERSRRELNVLMGRSPDAEVNVSRSITYAQGLDQERLVQEAMQGNVQLASATAQVRAAEVDQRIARSLRWPRLDVNANYGVSDQQNGVGLVLGTYTQGLNAGLTLSVPLFDGGRINTQAEQARLRAENAAIAEQQARLQVERDVRNAFTTWRGQREVLRIQGDAVTTAQLNFDRTRELFQAGQLTGLQFRQAQLDLANAERQAVVAGFDTKVAELTLLRASGGLLPALGVQP